MERTKAKATRFLTKPEYFVNKAKHITKATPTNQTITAESFGPSSFKYQNTSDVIHPILFPKSTTIKGISE